MNQNENSQFLGTEKITKLMVKFSVPCVLSLLVSAHKAIGTGITVTLAVSIILMAVFFQLKTQLLTLFGAALATVIGQTVSFVISLIYYFRTKTFRLTLKSFIPDMGEFKEALQLGASSFITQMTIVAISLVCNIMLAKYGAMSKYGVDIPIAVIGIASTLLFELAPDAVVGMFGTPTNIPNPGDYWEFGEKTFRIFLSLVTFTCTIKMTSIFFQAVGRPARAVIASMIRDIICFIPLIIILPVYFGIGGILAAAPAADLIAMIAAVIMTVTFFRQTQGKKE